MSVNCSDISGHRYLKHRGNIKVKIDNSINTLILLSKSISIVLVDSRIMSNNVLLCNVLS